MKPAERWTDAEIDAALRDVAVPASLAERLRPEALFDDSVIDRILGAVPVPAGLATRLKVTENSATVPPREQRPGRRPGSAECGSGCGRPSATDWPSRLSLGVVATMFIAGLRIAEWAQGPGGSRLRGTSASTTARSPQARSGRRRRMAATAWRSTSRSSRPRMEALPRRALQPFPRQPRAGFGRRRCGRPRCLSPTAWGRWWAAARAGLFRECESCPTRAAGDSSAVRRAVPGMRGFDLAFEMAHGEAPFVDPSIVPELAVDRPPLVVATDSFDRVWPLPAGRRRRAELEGLRVEHLLAACPLGRGGRGRCGDRGAVGSAIVASGSPDLPGGGTCRRADRDRGCGRLRPANRRHARARPLGRPRGGALVAVRLPRAGSRSSPHECLRPAHGGRRRATAARGRDPRGGRRYPATGGGTRGRNPFRHRRPRRGGDVGS